MLTANDEAKNKVYNVAVGENYSINYLFTIQLKNIWKAILNPFIREPREGDIRNSLADISLAKNLFEL